MFLLFFGMLLEIIGIGSLIPLLEIISDPENSTKYLNILGVSKNIIVEDFFFMIIIFIFCLFLFKTFYLSFLLYFQNLSLEKISHSIFIDLYTKYIYQSYLDHTLRDTSEIIKILQIESLHLLSYLRHYVHLVVEIMLSVSVIITIIVIEPQGTLIMGLLLGISTSTYYIIVKAKVENWGTNRQILDKSISKNVLESLESIMEVKILQKENFFLEKIKNLSRNKHDISGKFQTISQLPRQFLEITTVGSLLVFILITYKISGNLNQIVSVIGIFIAATFRVVPSLNRILGSIQGLKYNYPSLNKIFKELNSNTNPEINIKPLNKKTNDRLDFYNNIELKNITFTYNEKTILKNLNLKIEKDEIIGIMGDSGSGKSTFVNVLSGLIYPHKGSLIIDNIEINFFDRLWKHKIGYVGQEIYLLNDNVKNNIAFGINEEEIDLERINACIEMVELKEFVYSLNEGLYTNVGDRGSKISGGQKQRIGLARALYLNPEILILDESTSSLDSMTEKNILKTIYSLKGKKTIIMIAHNKSVLYDCNKIYNLENGVLIQFST
jgi:ATP-binding cassette, subfamily B, bacterial PglK